MKRVVGAVALVCALVATGAGAASVMVDGVEWEYSLGEDGNAVVTGGGPEAGALDIPGVLDGHPVTEIGIGAFSGCAGLTSATVPAGVTNINRQGIAHCTGLTTLSLPDGLEHIGLEAFRGCSGLKELSIPGSVESIENLAFYYCTGLEKLVFGEGVKSIGFKAFFYCYNLTALEIPDSVTTIREQAFETCKGLTSVHIGKGVENLDSRAFSYAVSLPAFEVDPGNPFFVSVDGVIFTKDMKSLVEFPCGKSGAYVLPDGVETIRTGGVSYCMELTSFEFSDSVSVIEDVAFFGCHALNSLSFGASLTEIGRDALTYCDALAEFRVDAGNPAFSSIDGVLFDKDAKSLLAFPGGRGGAYEVPAGVEEIAANAFRYCRKLEAVVLPEGVKRIESNAFDGCSLLREVSLSSTLESIGSYAFGLCPALASVDFPDGLTSIGQLAFYRCTGLVALSLPASVKSIDSSVFEECSSLWTMCVPASWKGSSILSRAGVPSGCTVVYGGRWAFEVDGEGNATVTGVPEGVTRLAVPPMLEGHPVVAIGSEAVAGREELEILRISDGVREIEDGAFVGAGLARLSVPGAWQEGNVLDGAAVPEGCFVLYRGDPPDDSRYAEWAEGYGLAPEELPADGDPDGDGAGNWDEFVAGTHPLDRGEVLRVSIEVEGGQIGLSVSPRKDDRTYSYSGTESLLSGEGGWTEIPDEEVERLDTSTTMRFFKVEVEYPQGE